MIAILQFIEGAKLAGETIYVHCWGGVGRTGTVIGCHLVEKGRHCDDALALIQALFETMDKVRNGNGPGRTSPETRAQSGFVRFWPAGRTDADANG